MESFPNTWTKTWKVPKIPEQAIMRAEKQMKELEAYSIANYRNESMVSLFMLGCRAKRQISFRINYKNLQLERVVKK